MNYDHLNKIYSYWNKKIRPYLSHHQNIASFDDYLKRFSYLPSGNWLREFLKIKLGRLPFAVNVESLAKKYKDACVSYNAPTKPEDGFQRAVYQVTPTLHFESAYWLWVENEEVQSYATVFSCYHDEEEYADFVNGLYKMRMEGNTEDKKQAPGFLGMALPD